MSGIFCDVDDTVVIGNITDPTNIDSDTLKKNIFSFPLFQSAITQLLVYPYHYFGFLSFGDADYHSDPTNNLVAGPERILKYANVTVIDPEKRKRIFVNSWYYRNNEFAENKLQHQKEICQTITNTGANPKDIEDTILVEDSEDNIFAHFQSQQNAITIICPLHSDEVSARDWFLTQLKTNAHKKDLAQFIFHSALERYPQVYLKFLLKLIEANNFSAANWLCNQGSWLNYLPPNDPTLFQIFIKITPNTEHQLLYEKIFNRDNLVSFLNTEFNYDPANKFTFIKITPLQFTSYYNDPKTSHQFFQTYLESLSLEQKQLFLAKFYLTSLVHAKTMPQALKAKDLLIQFYADIFNSHMLLDMVTSQQNYTFATLHCLFFIKSLPDQEMTITHYFENIFNVEKLSLMQLDDNSIDLLVRNLSLLSNERFYIMLPGLISFINLVLKNIPINPNKNKYQVYNFSITSLISLISIRENSHALFQSDETKRLTSCFNVSIISENLLVFKKLCGLLKTDMKLHAWAKVNLNLNLSFKTTLTIGNFEIIHDMYDLLINLGFQTSLTSSQQFLNFINTKKNLSKTDIEQCINLILSNNSNLIAELQQPESPILYQLSNTTNGVRIFLLLCEKYKISLNPALYEAIISHTCFPTECATLLQYVSPPPDDNILATVIKLFDRSHLYNETLALISKIMTQLKSNSANVSSESGGFKAILTYALEHENVSLLETVLTFFPKLSNTDFIKQLLKDLSKACLESPPLQSSLDFFNKALDWSWQILNSAELKNVELVSELTLTFARTAQRHDSLIKALPDSDSESNEDDSEIRKPKYQTAANDLLGTILIIFQQLYQLNKHTPEEDNEIKQTLHKIQVDWLPLLFNFHKEIPEIKFLLAASQQQEFAGLHYFEVEFDATTTDQTFIQAAMKSLLHNITAPHKIISSFYKNQLALTYSSHAIDPFIFTHDITSIQLLLQHQPSTKTYLMGADGLLLLINLLFDTFSQTIYSSNNKIIRINHPEITEVEVFIPAINILVLLTHKVFTQHWCDTCLQSIPNLEVMKLTLLEFDKSLKNILYPQAILQNDTMTEQQAPCNMAPNIGTTFKRKPEEDPNDFIQPLKIQTIETTPKPN